MDHAHFLSAQVCTLFIAADALVNVMSLHQILLPFTRKERFRLLMRESVFALFIMVVLYHLFSWVIPVLEVDPHVILVAGGLGITCSGMRTILGSKKEEHDHTTKSFISYTAPIAMPLMVGPSWLVACCILISKHLGLHFDVTAIFWSWLAVALFTMCVQLGLSGRKNSTNILLSIQTILGLFVTILGSQLLISGLQQTFL